MLARLVDAVFMNGEEGKMFRGYPALFAEDNRENLLVMADNGVVVSHFGQTQRWATLAGCSVRVACVGSVSTYESYRGQGLASELFKAAREKAARDGVDFMMISGDLNLYLRAGATFVARDTLATLERAAAERLRRDSIRLDPMMPGDVPLCAAAYAARPTRFVRLHEDWTWFLESGYCAVPSEGTVVRNGDSFGGYLVHRHARDSSCARIGEWAGDAGSVAGALCGLLERYGVERVTVHLQRDDVLMREHLREAGAELTETVTSGTYLLINFEQLMARLRPWFEVQLGPVAARRIEFRQEGDRFVFTNGDERHVAEGLTNAARLIFGHPEFALPEGFLRRIFPVPALWYGINYV